MQSNILVEEMISGQGERFRARIADFGSAKLFEIENDVQVTGGTSASISMPWTPPEYVTYSDTTGDAVIDYSHPTCAGDIWSFGCTFLEVGCHCTVKGMLVSMLFVDTSESGSVA